jgi:hypothetical protein
MAVKEVRFRGAVAVVFTPVLNMMSARPMRLDAIAAAD